LRQYEKKAFIQIFLGYFISVTIFIILLGFLYMQQQKNFILQKVAMSMHQYLLKVKHSRFQYKQKHFYVDMVFNAKVKKQLPTKEGNYYKKAFSPRIIVKVDAKSIDMELEDIKYFTIALQILLIMLFALISFILTQKSLKPMIDTFSHLDRFTKDLIHDLNTPITSIILNTNMLKKEATEQSLQKIIRIENSAKNISSLYANLEIILDEKHLQKEPFDLNILISQIIDTYKLIYPNITFLFDSKKIFITSNQNALKRILDNIISNSCKYSIEEKPYIYICFLNNILTIKDNGKGIKYPNKIFDRNYTENNSGHGIGMDIVYRLCSELNIKIEIISKKGTQINLAF
jgi:two-component system OmpR family sensor kinase